MRCKNCGKEIDEFEVFCDECKKELRKSSSKKDVEELEELIEEQEQLNELEKTKELPDLSELVEEKIEEINNEEIDSELQTREQSVEKVATKPQTREEKYEEKEELVRENKSKKKLIVIVLVLIFIIALISIIALLLINNKKDNKDNSQSRINYEIVLKDYAKSIETTVTNYMTQNNGEIPTWKQVNELNNYKEYEVVCNIHNIYSDGSIYLNECKINDEKIKYSYGKEKEEIKPGKKIAIYKYKYGDGQYYYLDKKENETTLAGEVTCKTNNCDYVVAYDKYVIVKEQNKYYLYNYETNSIELGPFDVDYIYNQGANLLYKDNTLYAVYYKEDGKNNLYNVSNGKTFTNLKGYVAQNTMSLDPTIMFKYGYVILIDNNVNTFVNLKTGNISYKINGDIGSFIEDKKNKIVYMTVYTSGNYNKFKIYNSHGKLLFGGDDYSNYHLGDKYMLVSNDTDFKVYDSKLNLKLSSKSYDKILGLYDDFVVVIDNNHLEIVDLNDKILATFDFEWNSKYYFHSMISGMHEDNGKKGIYLAVENTEIPSGTLGNGLKCFYIPETGEIGVIERETVGLW